MSPERNAPCPCGSGKKYKKCCGAAAAIVTPDAIGLNRGIAYKGAVGRARQSFCESYAAQKKALIKGIEDALRRDIESAGKTISCGKGCGACCCLFVVASLRECEAVVHYLYRHEAALQHFIRAFDGWRDGIRRIEPTFRRINDLNQKITAKNATGEEKSRFDEECGAYARAGIFCPFLVDGACSIYEVRPFVCAAVVATTPPGWCQPSHPRHAEAVFFKTVMKSGCDMPYFALPRGKDVFASMPSLVYNILCDGYAALAAVPGLENLESQAMSDPEVRAILAGVES